MNSRKLLRDPTGIVSSESRGNAALDALLLSVVDAALAGCILLVPFVLGGRHAVGQLVLVSLAVAAAAAWTTRQCLRPRGSVATYPRDGALGGGCRPAARAVDPLASVRARSDRAAHARTTAAVESRRGARCSARTLEPDLAHAGRHPRGDGSVSVVRAALRGHGAADRRRGGRRTVAAMVRAFGRGHGGLRPGAVFRRQRQVLLVLSVAVHRHVAGGEGEFHEPQPFCPFSRPGNRTAHLVVVRRSPPRAPDPIGAFRDLQPRAPAPRASRLSSDGRRGAGSVCRPLESVPWRQLGVVPGRHVRRGGVVPGGFGSGKAHCRPGRRRTLDRRLAGRVRIRSGERPARRSVLGFGRTTGRERRAADDLGSGGPRDSRFRPVGLGRRQPSRGLSHVPRCQVGPQRVHARRERPPASDLGDGRRRGRDGARRHRVLRASGASPA